MDEPKNFTTANLLGTPSFSMEDLIREGGEKGREFFLDEEARHAIDAMFKCRAVLVFQLVV